MSDQPTDLWNANTWTNDEVLAYFGFPSNGSFRLHELVELARTNKILAIKLFRICTQSGLKDAKDVIEMLMGQTTAIRKDDPRFKQSATPLYSSYEQLKEDLAYERKRTESYRTELKKLRDTESEVTRLKTKANALIRALNELTASLAEESTYNTVDPYKD